jgi:hypothetical protein
MGTKKTRKTRKTRKAGGAGSIYSRLSSMFSARPNDPELTWLLTVCQDTDKCLALGQHTQQIKDYFENFQNLSLIRPSTIKRIGSKSANGFILQLPFVKNDYTAYTVLKCSKDERADNLYYEYFVGSKYINMYVNRFPCFVETYGLYIIKSERFWESMKTNYKNIQDLSKYMTLQSASTVSWADSCEYNKLACVMTQHFNQLQLFHNMYNNYYDRISGELPQLLFQVYYVLAKLKNEFTHYDLHTSNVCMYKPFNGNKYILMHYMLPEGGELVFPTEFIMKIIDYGRCFFVFADYADTGSIINDKICKLAECQPKCGNAYGYANINGSISRSPVYVDPRIRNWSRDLLLAYTVMQWEWKNNKPFFYINYKSAHGTPEINDTYIQGAAVGQQQISTVDDMYKTLVDYLLMAEISNKYENWQKMADMYVYPDRPYRLVGNQGSAGRRRRPTAASAELTRLRPSF